MSWILRHRLRTFLQSSLCAVPIACMLAAMLVAPVVRAIDDRTRWALLDFGIEGSRVVVGALASSLLTFIVFAFSIILLAVQIASGQLSPRIIARVLESRLTKLTLGVFVFSFTYTLAALGRIEDRVPQLPVLVAVLSSLLSIALFLYFIQKAGQSFRPIMILTGVAGDTRAVIQALYPAPFSHEVGQELPPDLSSSPPRTITHSGRSGVVLAFDAIGLVEIARSVNCTIELVPEVGDFLATGEDMFRLYGSGRGAAPVDSLRRCVALGPERALEKDPAFGFRILVDIASKALSPAINDPTTGALAVDQIYHLLHLLGQRQLESGIVRDPTGPGSPGHVRLVFPTPSWGDFVSLAVTEIRTYGGPNPQVTRRLQAMFEQLVQVLPAERAVTLHKEMALLRRTIDRSFADPEDRILSGTSDSQGFGGHRPGAWRAV
ncbi:MAG TPA: DUF2254 domain-containing protein [Bryobacteraceae bacterium]|nr:DUF2254 domain-containing protein [Bryobacteraceae bacterium]